MDDNVFLIFGYLASGTAYLMMFPQIYLTTQKKKIEDLSITLFLWDYLFHSLQTLSTTNCQYIPWCM